MSERSPDSEVGYKPKSSLQFDPPGHYDEYVFLVEKWRASDPDTLPPEIGEVVREELGADWDVMDRGSRIEVVKKAPKDWKIGEQFNKRDDDKVVAAFQKALAALGDPYEFRLPK